MKIKTPFFTLEIEVLFLIIILVAILSTTFRNYISSYFICYLFILFHELSHMFLAAVLGKEIDNFKFSVSGVSIRFKYNSIQTYKLKTLQEIFIYLAGPFSNLFLAMLFSNNSMIFQINLFLALINLLPIYPLDGYNILKSILNNKYNIKNTLLFLSIVSKIMFILLTVLAIIQIILFKNPSILIFLIYVYIIDQANKKYKGILKYNIC